MPPQPNIPAFVRQYIPNGQQVLTLIKRHVIGLIYIYLIIIAAAAAFGFLILALAPEMLSSTSGILSGSLAAVLIIALVIFILIIVTNIYWHNTMVITDKETIQVLQRGVFQLKVSHLSHADIEDITAEQNGLMPTIFNYGTLHIETSGELKNFAFSYCPDPDRYARIVLEARQRFTETTAG